MYHDHDETHRISWYNNLTGREQKRDIHRERKRATRKEHQRKVMWDLEKRGKSFIKERILKYSYFTYILTNMYKIRILWIKCIQMPQMVFPFSHLPSFHKTRLAQYFKLRTRRKSKNRINYSFYEMYVAHYNEVYYTMMNLLKMILY